MSIAIGIDPGKKGAMAAIHEDGSVSVIPFDERRYIVFLGLIAGNDVKCCIEDVHAMHGNGVTASFNFGKSYGWLLGMLDTLGIPYQAVSVQKWKKEYGLNSDKAKSIEVCRRLFPNVSLKRTVRCKTDSSDMAEALLMAEYARRHF